MFARRHSRRLRRFRRRALSRKKTQIPVAGTNPFRVPSRRQDGVCAGALLSWPYRECADAPSYQVQLHKRRPTPHRSTVPARCAVPAQAASGKVAASRILRLRPRHTAAESPPGTAGGTSRCDSRYAACPWTELGTMGLVTFESGPGSHVHH